MSMFKNLGNLTQLAGMFKNLGQIGTKMADAKAQLATQQVTAEDDSSAVKIEMNGLGEMTHIHIQEQFLTPEMQAQLQQSILVASNRAIQQAKKLHVEKIREMTNGVDIPGLDGIIEELSK